MAYQPRFTGVNLRMPGAKATPIQRLILANRDLINEEPGRNLEVDTQLGFACLRRTELCRIAKRYHLDINENEPVDIIISKMESYFDDGRLPAPSEEDKNKKALIEALKSMPREELKALLGEKPKKPGRPPKNKEPEDHVDGVHAS